MGTILIKNGRVFDGSQFFQADVFTKDGIVEKIAPHIDCKAGYTYDASGMTVMPGLVDVHMHIKGFSSVKWATPADSSCFPFGVTAAADASADFGNEDTAQTFGVKTCVFVLCGTRQSAQRLEKAAKMQEQYGSLVAGFKICYDANDDPDLKDAASLAELSKFAHDRGLRLTVHTSNCPIPMAQLLEALHPGDIATHIYHGGGHTVAEDDFASLLEAKKRGVILDAGLAGSGHVDFTIFKNAIATGAVPDVISTDLVWQIAFTKGGRYGLPMCMSVARHLGMQEQDVLRCVTTSAGNALGRPWGVLKEGGCADIAVLEYGNEPFDLTDRNGCRVQSSTGYRCHLTVADGKVVYCEGI